MQKSRKIKIDGVEYRYFIDPGAEDEDGDTYTRAYLYAPGNITYWWNGAKENMGNRDIKKAVREGKFFNLSGRLLLP